MYDTRFDGHHTNRVVSYELEIVGKKSENENQIFHQEAAHMIPNIEPTLYIDMQIKPPGGYSPYCGGELYLPSLLCCRCGGKYYDAQ